MSAGDELEVASAWIYATLSGDADLVELLAPRAGAAESIYPDVLPQGAAAPAVLYGLNTDTMVGGQHVGTTPMMSNMLVMVKGITQAESYAGTPRAIARRIDQLLQGATGTVAVGELEGLIFGCTRVGTIAYPETDAGIQWRHRGAMYRLYVQ